MKSYTIKKTAGISIEQLYDDLSHGGRIVSYGYCVSIIAMTYRLMSSPHFIRPDEKISKYRMGYNLRSLILGWWGLPWGPIYTIDMIKINAKTGGGIDVTEDLLIKIQQQYSGSNTKEILSQDLTVNYNQYELIN
ncbi:hypothetical protein [Mucilaginibacter paludis]|uniref:Uncharacterized protein n=1 Tax=Mucilaginibacter paludis DSM 18603 TaxID=714943 RepID=H1YF76_9SPHI|nr:hypothetical protein [Mucilaginibacter paludis]EHQ26215.1 hypothetical protein Mucpa_2075 [Mucilaginibacter paludis DSM 18603]